MATAMAMGMNIKDPQVHAMARELAARRESLLQVLSACRDLPWPDQCTSAELEAELYDEAGLSA